MLRSMRYSKIARALVGKATEEIVKTLLRNQHPDLYFSLEEELHRAMDAAYTEGLVQGRKEVTDIVLKFDADKDRLES